MPTSSNLSISTFSLVTIYLPQRIWKPELCEMYIVSLFVCVFSLLSAVFLFFCSFFFSFLFSSFFLSLSLSKASQSKLEKVCFVLHLHFPPRPCFSQSHPEATSASASASASAPSRLLFFLQLGILTPPFPSQPWIISRFSSLTIWTFPTLRRAKDCGRNTTIACLQRLMLA